MGTQKRVCLLTLAGLPLQQMLKQFPFSTYWPCHVAVSGHFEMLPVCSRIAAPHLQPNRLLITVWSFAQPLNHRAAVDLRHNPHVEKCRELIESNTETTTQQNSWDAEDYRLKFVPDCLIRSPGTITWLPLWPCIVWQVWLFFFLCLLNLQGNWSNQQRKTGL